MRRRPLQAWLPSIVLTVVCLLAVVVVSLGLNPRPAPSPTAVHVSSGTWAPFVGPELADGGPLAALVTEALRHAGFDPTVTYSSWGLAEERMATGSAVAAFPLVRSASRDERFLVSAPLVDFEYVLFHDSARGAPRIDTAADLHGLRVGAIVGYDYWPELDDAVDRYVVFDSTLEAFEALAAGEVDVVAEGLLPGRETLVAPAFPGDASRFVPVPGDSPLVRSVQSLHLMMPSTRESRAVMAAFDEALGELRASPEHADLVAALGSVAPDRVVLDAGPGVLVELLDDTGAPVLVAPRGTSARVLEWPEELLAPAGVPGTAPLARVKVLDGPARGRVALVDARALELEAHR